jgi:hypothetical protein
MYSVYSTSHIPSISYIQILKSYLLLVSIRVYHIQEEQNSIFKKPIANTKVLFIRLFILYRLVVNVDYVKGTAHRGL